MQYIFNHPLIHVYTNVNLSACPHRCLSRGRLSSRRLVLWEGQEPAQLFAGLHQSLRQQAGSWPDSGAAWPRVLHGAAAVGTGAARSFPSAGGDAEPGLAPGRGGTPSVLPTRCRQLSCPCQAGAAVMNPARCAEGAWQPVYLQFMRAPSCPSRRFQFRLSVFPH